ncbi:integrase arm-type DNA-binding domain-containing protein [Bradyrhizobium sp. 200]|uniref:tyrosine-type recombinase/integrase n=1 Tax=Bradyrhizobium sp. 200 TaxID=2782665 RepID=UPI001FFF3DA1|nr:site-specific integrase [Bradyrhizobium sp. 200]UPJ50774.1 integrase arm-type DNA-binding domain-containing protein [Bradyrhizobium sp. 200]
MSKHETGRLTPEQIATTTDGRYNDGKGLSLRVRGGVGTWFYQYRVGERVREIGLGGRDVVTVEQAREAAQGYREMRADGRDPLEAKRKEQKAVTALNSRATFGEFAAVHIRGHVAPGMSAKTAGDWLRSIKRHCAPLMLMRPADIELSDVEACLRPIWMTKKKTAAELRGRLERLLDAAVVSEPPLRPAGDNPARWEGGLRERLPAQKRKEKHHPAAPYKEVPAIVKALRADVSEFDLSSLALEFVILTAVRTGDARFMTVGEVDLESATWTIPADRMKTRNDPDAPDHPVPLPARALEIVKAQIDGKEPKDLVFPGLKRGQPLGMNTMNHALARHRKGLTVHGFRSSFRDWVSDETEYGWELGEHALAHKVGTKVARAYARSRQLEKRRPMMDDWAAYVNQTTA